MALSNELDFQRKTRRKFGRTIRGNAVIEIDGTTLRIVKDRRNGGRLRVQVDTDADAEITIIDHEESNGS